jgi:capsular polysaccharide export protein
VSGPGPTRIGYFSAGIGRIPHLEAFLDATCVRLRPWSSPAGLDAVAGWGHKPTADRARAFAARHGLPYLRLEDGFLRSLGLGVEGAVRHSLSLDRTGVYYDATGPSDVERRIHEDALDDAARARAEDCMARIRRARLSKYNHAPDRLPAGLARGDRPPVLVVDQTLGDASVRLGGADAGSFARMLEAARDESPGAPLWVKTHPDVVAGRKAGYLPRAPGCTLLAEDVSPWALLDAVERVYVVTSQLGFEALLAGRPVRCFGLPFYAGWGLTEDALACPRRGVSRDLARVFAAAYLEGCRYVNPHTGTPCRLEDTIALLSDQRRARERGRGDWLAVGLPRWKRRFVGRFLGDAARVRHGPPRAVARVPAGTRVLAWASRVGPELEAACAVRGHGLWRIEDGFVRSVGLGVDLVEPLSVVLDARGIYYDARSASDLEVLLETADFPPELLARARRLRERLVALGLTKYNVGGATLPALPRDRPVVLVPGQVETDASIRQGAGAIATNRGLLEAVRGARPGAYVVYKPHPDVVAGGRLGGCLDEGDSLYDAVVTDASIPSLLEGVAEVHTLTSLAGFEALLRGRRVVTWGRPFYAGWGLTEDRLPCPRRTRRLALDELVAGALLAYPVYADPQAGMPVNAETALELLVRQRAAGAATALRTRVYRRLRRPV